MRRDGVRRIVGALKLTGVDPAGSVILFTPPPRVEVSPPPTLRQPDGARPDTKAADRDASLAPIHRDRLLGGQQELLGEERLDLGA